MLETNTLLKNDHLKQFKDAASGSSSKVVCDHSLGQFPFMAICETQQKNNKVYTQIGGKSLDGVKIADKKNICEVQLSVFSNC